MSQVNTARFIVSIVARYNDLAAFKVRFVILFHATLSLQKLLDPDRRDRFLHPDAVRHIGNMLRADSVGRVRKNKSLPNNLVHYGIDDRTASELSSDLPVFCLVEACSSGRTVVSMANDVALGLDRLADGFRGLLPDCRVPAARYDLVVRSQL